MARRARASVAATALVLFASCGGGSRTGPTSVTVPPAGLASGTVLTLVSGETGAAVAGATVTIGAQTLTSDGAGEVRLTALAPLGAAIDIVHPAYLDRLSTVRTDAGQRFALWPKSTGAGLSEHYTATLVYTSTTDPPGPTGDASLSRLPRGASMVVVVPSDELLADGPSMDAHTRAVAALGEATGGAVGYVLAPTRPATGIVVTTRFDASDALCLEGGVRAFMRGTYQGRELRGGEVVYCSMNAARTGTVTHELGHTFGLRHAPEARDVMSSQFSQARATTFGPRESLVMRLMLDRPAGNRYPDNDRSASGSTSTTEIVTVCH